MWLICCCCFAAVLGMEPKTLSIRGKLSSLRCIPSTHFTGFEIPKFLDIHSHSHVNQGRPSNSPVTAVATSKEKSKGKGIQTASDFLTMAGSHNTTCYVGCWGRKNLSGVRQQIPNATRGTVQAGQQNSGMKVMGTTNHLALDLRPALLQGTHAWYCKLAKSPWLGRSLALERTFYCCLIIWICYPCAF